MPGTRTPSPQNSSGDDAFSGKWGGIFIPPGTPAHTHSSSLFRNFCIVGTQTSKVCLERTSHDPDENLSKLNFETSICLHALSFFLKACTLAFCFWAIKHAWLAWALRQGWTVAVALPSPIKTHHQERKNIPLPSRWEHKAHAHATPFRKGRKVWVEYFYPCSPLTLLSKHKNFLHFPHTPPYHYHAAGTHLLSEHHTDSL